MTVVNFVEIALKLVLVFIGLIIVSGTLLSVLRTYVLARSAPDAMAALVIVILRRIFGLFLKHTKTYTKHEIASRV